MKVWKLTAATWLAFFMVIGQAHAAERFTPSKRHEHCRYESWSKSNGFTDTEVRLTIDCATDHFPVVGGDAKAFAIAQRESGMECASPLDRARYDASGVFQVVSGTWSSWWGSIRPRFGGWNLRNNRYLCRANVMISIAAAHRYGWGAWGG